MRGCVGEGHHASGDRGNCEWNGVYRRRHRRRAARYDQLHGQRPGERQGGVLWCQVRDDQRCGADRAGRTGLSSDRAERRQQ